MHKSNILTESILFLVAWIILSASSLQGQSLDKAKLDRFMDNWHAAAAEANAEDFFSKMSDSAVYIGTDREERWFRDELRTWSKKAFERESAWTFKAKERNWQWMDNFWICDEVLDTWMGECRSTAVLILVNEELKIQHYQLSVTIDNEKIEAFKELANSP